MITSRRSFFLGATAFLAAPAIVRAASLMPVPEYAVVPLYRFHFGAQGGTGNNVWNQTMSTLAPSYEAARKHWNPPPDEPVRLGYWVQSQRPVEYRTTRRHAVAIS